MVFTVSVFRMVVGSRVFVGVFVFFVWGLGEEFSARAGWGGSRERRSVCGG